MAWHFAGELARCGLRNLISSQPGNLSSKIFRDARHNS
jgi:hypothetical protein